MVQRTIFEPDPKFTKDHVVAKLNLRRVRLAQNLTVQEAADLAGVSRTMLEDIESIRTSGSFLELGRMAKLCRAYKVSIQELFYEMSEDEIERVNTGQIVIWDMLPCPHCGAWEWDEGKVYDEEGDHEEIICTNCGATAQKDRWNERADIEQ